MKTLFLVAIALCAATAARAEVKKFLNICDGKMCPYYEIVLTPPSGWTKEEEASKESQVQMIVPQGKNFRNAEALVYIKVSHKDKDQSLADFIRVSQERWRKAVPDTKISKLPTIARANNKPAFEPYRYTNPSQSQQAFEIVSFGVDSDADGNDFFVMAVMTGRSKKALDQAEKPYKTLLNTH